MAWYKPTTWFAKPHKHNPVLKKETRGEYIDVKGSNEGLRRFDSAGSNRINSALWTYAHGQSINVDLFESLENLQARCAWEAANNALVDGAIETLAVDVFGEKGPTLRVLSASKRFNNLLESVWRDVWEMPDPNGRISGVEGGYTWIRSLCTAGSFLNVYANTDREGPVKFGWSSVHARRLGGSSVHAGDPNVAFGQKLNDAGKVLEYYIRRQSQNGIGLYDAFDVETIPARFVQHRYKIHEPEQLTGIPWLSSCLDTVANLRQYDHFVMEAAKLAANSASSLETSNPEFAVDPTDLTNTTLDWEPTSVNIAPKGWKWVNHQSTQPSAEYNSFRHERLRELGLSLGMPLMMILLSSADSNFSSAHYDGAVYMRRIKAIDSWLSLRTLRPLVKEVVKEQRFSRVSIPSDYQLMWSWPVPPYVNPEKQKKADRIDLEDGTKSVQQLIVESGGDPDVVLKEREEYIAECESRGLPLGPDFRAASQLYQIDQQNEQESNQEEGSDANRFSVTT